MQESKKRKIQVFEAISYDNGGQEGAGGGTGGGGEPVGGGCDGIYIRGNTVEGIMGKHGACEDDIGSGQMPEHLCRIILVHGGRMCIRNCFTGQTYHFLDDIEDNIHHVDPSFFLNAEEDEEGEEEEEDDDEDDTEDEHEEVAENEEEEDEDEDENEEE